jgi:DNA-binding XRE family transcriptional regulator
MPSRECDLKPGERLRLYRRRLKLNRRALGTALNMTWRQIAEIERGDRDLDPAAITWHGEKDLRAHEKCWVYRTRCGKSQADVAGELEVSRLWVNKMERGEVNCDKLIWYWEA